MQIFGLLSLLIVIGLAGWWLSSSMNPSQSVQNEDGTYQEAVGAAEDVVKKSEERNDDISYTTGNSVVVYDGISVSDNTIRLDLSDQGLSGSLKAEIRNLTDLKELNISNNNFTGLPAEIGQLSKLEVLNLSNNPFTGLPQELGNLKNLRVLDLRGTQYSEFDLNIIKGNLSSSVSILVD